MRSPSPRHDAGFVMVPTIILMIVAVMLGFALLAVTDTQIRESGRQRQVDAAQTLAEGAATAAANTMATDGSSTLTDASDPVWRASGSCVQVAGDLVTDPGAEPSDAAARFAWKVRTEVQARFAGTSGQFADDATDTTTWSVLICPVQGTATGAGTWDQSSETRWDDSFAARTVTQPAGTGPQQLSMWVRGEAKVRAATGATGTQMNARAAVTKVRQSFAGFTPRPNFAVGTGGFSTDGQLTSNTVITSGVAGPLAGDLAGGAQLVADSSSKLGVRCGLLTTLSAPHSTCVSGGLAGGQQALGAAGLGTLGNELGTSRLQTLPDYSMAPQNAIDAYRAVSKSQNLDFASVPGYDDDHISGFGGGQAKRLSGTPTKCLSDSVAASLNASSVVFLEQVGNGEGYCTIDQNITVKMLVVAKGAVRITGNVKGIVDALNDQECAEGDTSCDRSQAVPREIVRLEGSADGKSGTVTGQVWADGAGGQVGIYPAIPDAQLGTSLDPALLAQGPGPAGICGASGMPTALAGLNSLVSGVATNLLNVLAFKNTKFISGLTSTSTGCDALKKELGAMQSSDLYKLLQNGGTVSVHVSQSASCTLPLLSSCGTYTADAGTAVTIPPLGSVLASQLAGVLAGAAAPYTAITYDPTAVSNATVNVTQGAGPVAGSYRNVTPT